jgi:hypothetical protein
MRLLAYILTFYILFLAAAPSLPLLSCGKTEMKCEKACCHMKNMGSNTCHKKGPEKGNCNGAGCNAFMSCCNGVALTRPTGASFLPLAYSIHTYSSKTETVFSNFLSDAWHPPCIMHLIS